MKWERKGKEREIVVVCLLLKSLLFSSLHLSLHVSSPYDCSILRLNSLFSLSIHQVHEIRILAGAALGQSNCPHSPASALGRTAGRRKLHLALGRAAVVRRRHRSEGVVCIRKRGCGAVRAAAAVRGAGGRGAWRGRHCCRMSGCRSWHAVARSLVRTVQVALVRTR
jgi:hypothetical protein